MSTKKMKNIKLVVKFLFLCYPTLNNIHKGEKK